MIQALMLIALGFLMASLIGVLLAPSLWSRAYRLSRKRLENTLPLTLTEIEATQDQLRAEYAVRLRRFETALARARQKAAMQLVDNSRLQMQIAALKDQIADLNLNLSERSNAATVLEQAITKRFPELDREIAALKVQLQARAYELQDLTNKLGRRDEEVAAAERAASLYQEELSRVRQALEKGSGDRSGRLLRRASQWNLDDYRAEYDRLNLDLSKLRQQLAQMQDRDAQQVGVIKGELQKLAELILASAQPRSDDRAADRIEPGAKRASLDMRRDRRPAPWLDPQPLHSATLLEKESDTLPPANASEAVSTPESASPIAMGSASLSSHAGGLSSDPATGSADEVLTAAAAEKPPGTEVASALSSLLRNVASDKPGEPVPQPKSTLVDAHTERFRNGADHPPSSGKEKDVPEEASSVGDRKSEALINKANEAKPEKPSSDALDLPSLAELLAMTGNGSQHANELSAGSELQDREQALPKISGDAEIDGPAQNRTLLDRLRGVTEKAN